MQEVQTHHWGIHPKPKKEFGQPQLFPFPAKSTYHPFRKGGWNQANTGEANDKSLAAMGAASWVITPRTRRACALPMDFLRRIH